MNANIAAVDSVKAVGGVAAGAARIQGAAPSAAGAAAADAAGLRKGFKGLPFIDHNLVPLDARDNTVEHAKKIHHQAFVFNPLRKHMWDNTAPRTENSYRDTVRRIATVRELAMLHGRTITMNRVFANFKDTGLTANGEAVTNVEGVNKFFSSRAVMELFMTHPLLLLLLIFILFYRDTASNAIFDAWFATDFRNRMRADKNTPLDFDNFVLLEKSASNPNGPTRVMNSLLAIAKIAGFKCFRKGLGDICDAKFGMHLGLRMGVTEESREKYYPPIEIDLGQFNPHNVNTYVFVLRIAYPKLSCLGRNPTIEDLCNDDKINASPCAFFAFQLALTAANEGKTVNEAVEFFRVMNAKKLAAREGEKAANDHDKASAEGGGKKAAAKAALGHANDPCRMAKTTDGGFGSTVGDHVNGDSLTASVGHGSIHEHLQAHQQQVSHHVGDGNDAARMPAHHVMQQQVSHHVGDDNDAARMPAHCCHPDISQILLSLSCVPCRKSPSACPCPEDAIDAKEQKESTPTQKGGGSSESEQTV